jgi:hypothetical protein
LRQRRRLALKGKELTAEERRVCCQIVRTETILAWFRQLASQEVRQLEGSQGGIGWPRPPYCSRQR